MRRALLAGMLAAASCAAQSAGPVPATFFAMSAVRDEYPKLTIGTLAHQDFAWVTIERSRGSFNFQTFDHYLAAAQQNGLVDPATNTANFVMTLAAGTPSWALADHSTCPSGPGTVSCTAPPDNIQDWKDFLGAVIQHYNGQSRPHIRYYELWNEFNVNLWWTGTDAQLVALAQAAYPIIHQDPNSLLLTPSVAGPVGTLVAASDVTWMTRYLQAGGAKYADGGAFHGYIAGKNVNPFPMPEDDATSGCKAFLGCYGSIVTIATQMRAVFDQNGLAGKPMFQTEGSWGENRVTDPDAQVAWLARWNLLQAGLRASLNLQMAAWFTWGPPMFGWGTIETDSGDPTPAGLAYNQVYNWVVGATISQPCSAAADGTWTCTLTRNGGYVAQAVWNTKGSVAYTPGAAYTQFRDLAGNTTPLAAGASVTIGAKPILVEGTAPVCTYAISPGGQGFTAAGGGGAINITAPVGCPWTVTGAPAWVSFTGSASGSGNGSVSYTVAANNGGDQSATLMAAGLPFSIQETSAAIAGAVFAGSMAQIASAQGWDTAIELINLGATPAQARLSFFSDPSGGALQLPFTFPQMPSPSGPLLASTLDETINPKAVLVLDTTGPASANASIGVAQLQASGNVAGFGVFTNAAANWEAVVPLETRSAPSYVLAFDNTGGIATGLALANLTSQAANVNVVIRNASGAQIGGPQMIALAAEGHTSFMLNTTYKVTAGMRGTIEFDPPAGGAISVLGLRANGPALTTVPVLANVTPGTGTISHVTYNGGWNTIITLVNTGTAPATATVSFYDDNGNPLAVPLGDAPAAAVTVTLGAGQSVVYATQGQDGLDAVSGSAVVSSAGSVSGFAIFRNSGSGQEAVVPLETRQAASYVLGYDNTNGRATGLAVANATGQAANLAVTVRDDQGAVLANGALALAAHGHTAIVLPTGYPASVGKLGTVEIDGLAGFSALGLFVTPTGNVTTLPMFVNPFPPAPTLTYIPGSSVKLEQIIGDQDYQTKAPTTSQTLSRYNFLGSDIGYAFEDNGKMIFSFGDRIGDKSAFLPGHAFAWSTSTDPEAGLFLNFFTNPNGSLLLIQPPGINTGPDNIPNSGISLPDGVWFICNTGADVTLPNPHVNDSTLLAHFDEKTQVFTTGRTISRMPNGHFIIVAPHVSGSDVLMFGAGAYRASDIYLATVPVGSFASGVGTRYFAGLINGAPTWTNQESGAVPVVQDNPLGGPAWPNDKPTVGNLSVVYSSDLGLWLMTYDGGRLSAKTSGAYFTYAPQPWGPWATPQLIFNVVRDNALGTFIHDPSIVPDPPGDGLNGPTIGSADIYKTRGGDYAPLMIERFTRVAGNTLSIYYTMSTWNPYTVVRMRSRFTIASPAPAASQ